MPLTPPIDKIPKLPGQASNAIVTQVNKLVSNIVIDIQSTVSDAQKLPDNITCDDPRIQELKDNLQGVQDKISKLSDIIPVVNTVTTGIKSLIGISNAIKAAALLNPVTGPALLAQELVLAQAMTIANATVAVDQLALIGPSINVSIQSAVSDLTGVVNSISLACNQEPIEVSNELQNAINNTNTDGSISGGNIFNDDEIYNNPNGIGWGTAESRAEDATLGTEFYSNINVSESDLEQYANLINELIESQQSVLASIQEAPAQSYNGRGAPNTTLGKVGDYYIDTANQNIYGPKTINGWPRPVNY